MDQELQALRNEVEVLKEDQKALEEEVRRLRRAFAGLRAPDRQVGYPESEGSYSFIEGAAARSSIAPSSPARSVDSVGTRSFAASGASAVVPAATGLPQSWARREEIADGIGLWARRALSGENRGSSGRDQNPLQSRLWIVFRSIEGEDFNPPLVYRSWTGAKALVKRGPETGGSVFVGIPSEREAIRVVRFAGLEWSGTFIQ